MKNRQLHILFIGALLLFASACHPERKVYDSESDTVKKKKGGFALTKFNKLLKSNDSEAKLEAAKKYFDKKDYTKALMLLEELMTVYRGTSKAEEVQYYYANCNYFLNDYILAGYQFRTYVKNYPNSKHTEYCAFMNAYCFYLNSPEYSLEQVDTKLAIREFERFTSQYPKSEKIAECNELLDKLRAKLERKSYEAAILYYNMENYKSAITSFNNHNKDFTGNKHEEELKFLTIKSYYLLASNSIESKKEERYKATIESYIKFVDAFPNSKYIKDAENYYSNALKFIDKINKSTS